MGVNSPGAGGQHPVLLFQIPHSTLTDRIVDPTLFWSVSYAVGKRSTDIQAVLSS